MWWVIGIVILCVLVSIVVYFGYQLRMVRQYRKKQIADASLFQQVINHMNQRLSLEEAQNRFNITDLLPLLTYIKEKTKFPLTQNDRAKILVNGENTFQSLFHEIKSAKHHIHLLFYTIRDDLIGKELQRLLIKKAQEGVIVRILVDGVGSQSLSQQAIKKLERFGIQCGVFAPPKLSFILHINYRNHRKIAVIDGHIGFTGGLNIGDEYLHRDPKKGYWRDIHILVEGESVLLLQRIFATDWYYVMNQKIGEDEQYFPQYGDAKTFQLAGPMRKVAEKTILTQVVPSGPDMDKYVIKDVYRQMILTAKERIWIGTPYFVPDRRIMAALKEAIKKGIEVRLLVPYKTDNFLVQHAAIYYYRLLLKQGAKIFFYRKGFYHAKIALVDEKVAKIGSANMDQRSFHFSFEAGLFLYDPTICQRVKQLFLEDFQDSQLAQLNDLNKRTARQQLATTFSLLFSPWL